MSMGIETGNICFLYGPMPRASKRRKVYVTQSLLYRAGTWLQDCDSQMLGAKGLPWLGSMFVSLPFFRKGGVYGVVRVLLMWPQKAHPPGSQPIETECDFPLQKTSGLLSQPWWM